LSLPALLFLFLDVTREDNLFKGGDGNMDVGDGALTEMEMLYYYNEGR
jgi:hypothetical protein